jgi:beta-glucanase (GH16 family)
MFIMIVVLVTLFAAYPIISELTTKTLSTAGGFNLGGVNATGQLPDLNQFRLIDADTPESAYTHKSFEDGSEWQLVFSDEFNRPGRTFYEGDDPYWSAVDLHYWGTNNLEWYDPRAVYTENGHLTIQFTHSPNLHGMNFTGGSEWKAGQGQAQAG